MVEAPQFGGGGGAAKSHARDTFLGKWVVFSYVSPEIFLKSGDFVGIQDEFSRDWWKVG
jgi:hypothetical protein